MTSWKTTAAGIALILEAVASAFYAYAQAGALPDLGSLLAKVTAGIGLIAAKDHNVTNAVRPDVAKIAPLLLAALLAGLAASACVRGADGKKHFAPAAWTAGHHEQLAATAAVVEKRALSVAESVILSAAASRFEDAKNSDFLSSVAAGLRSHEADLLDSGDIAQIVRAWSPAAAKTAPPEWQALARQLAGLYLEAGRAGSAGAGSDSGPAPAAAVIVEAIASGLDQAAAK